MTVSIRPISSYREWRSTERIAGSTYLTVLDLMECYHQFLLEVESRPLTAYTIGGKKYMWTRGMFGLKIMGAIVQAAIAGIMDGMADVIVYIDDILIATHDTLEEHRERIR